MVRFLGWSDQGSGVVIREELGLIVVGAKQVALSPGCVWERCNYRAARVVGLEGRLVGSAGATGDEADTSAMVAVAIRA